MGVVCFGLLVPDHKSIIVPEAIATLVDEQEQMAVERILLKLFPHASEQPVKTLPHVHRIHAQKHLVREERLSMMTPHAVADRAISRREEAAESDQPR